MRYIAADWRCVLKGWSMALSTLWGQVVRKQKDCPKPFSSRMLAITYPHAHICTRTWTCIHTHTHMRLHWCIQRLKLVHIYSNTCMYTYKHSYIYTKYIDIHVRAYIDSCTYSCIHVFIYKYIRSRTLFFISISLSSFSLSLLFHSIEPGSSTPNEQTVMVSQDLKRKE